MDNNISFSKIVATPTLNSWSQAYNAGKLFAVLSLEKTENVNPDIESLNILGKDLLERLEQEFFTIEEKNLESIRKAISNTFEKITEGVNYSFTAGAFINNVLYLFALGKGKVFIKREGNFGLVLDSVSVDPKEIISSSGFLENSDLIVLTTDGFSQIITHDDLNSALNDSLPSEISESLAPKVHKAEDGRLASIIIKYGKTQTKEAVAEVLETEEEIEEVEKQPSPLNKYLIRLRSKLRKPNFKIKFTRKVFLGSAVLIACILAFSIFMTLQQQNNAKVSALFEDVYPQAQRKYEEGQSLLDLNKNLARDSFVSAQQILKENIDKFPPKSKEAVQTQDLLKKVEEGLTQASPVDSSGLDRSKLSITVQNGSGIEGTAGKAAGIIKGFGYNVPTTANADNFDYEGVTIKVKKENSNFLDLLKKDLAKEYTISASSSDLSSDSPSDAVIIVGK